MHDDDHTIEDKMDELEKADTEEEEGESAPEPEEE